MYPGTASPWRETSVDDPVAHVGFCEPGDPVLAGPVLPFDPDAVEAGPGDFAGDDVDAVAESEAGEDEVASWAAVFAVFADGFGDGVAGGAVEGLVGSVIG